MVDKVYYQIAAKEVANGNIDQALWIKVTANNPELNDITHKAKYVQLRASELSAENLKRGIAKFMPRTWWQWLLYAAAIFAFCGIFSSIFDQYNNRDWVGEIVLIILAASLFAPILIGYKNGFINDSIKGLALASFIVAFICFAGFSIDEYSRLRTTGNDVLDSDGRMENLVSEKIDDRNSYDQIASQLKNSCINFREQSRPAIMGFFQEKIVDYYVTVTNVCTNKLPAVLENMDFDEEVTSAEHKYPILDPASKFYIPALVNETKSRMQTLVNQGSLPSKALHQAISSMSGTLDEANLRAGIPVPQPDGY